MATECEQLSWLDMTFDIFTGNVGLNVKPFCAPPPWGVPKKYLRDNHCAGHNRMPTIPPQQLVDFEAWSLDWFPAKFGRWLHLWQVQVATSKF